MATHLAPLPVPSLDPLPQRIRRVVCARDELSAAFLYLRGTEDGGLHPAVGLLARRDLVADDPAVSDTIEAAGTIYDERPAVVGLAPDLDVLDAVLGVAPPLGAGGPWEIDLHDVATGRAREGDDPGGLDTGAAVRAIGGLVDAPLVVPTDGTATPARGRYGPGRSLHLPVATVGDDRGVGAFTSPWAMVHSVGPGPFSTIAGWAVVECLPDDVELVIDPGLPWAWAPPVGLLRRLARRRPTVVAP